MDNRTRPATPTGDRRALPVSVLGLLAAIAPIILFPVPGDGGPITFGVRLVQAIAGVVGLGVAVTGVYSYRTGDLRPAIAATATIVGLAIVGAVGSYVETTGGPLAPVWVWLLATITVVSISFVATYRYGD